MGEVDAVQHPVGERIAEGEQRVEGARMQPVEDLLEEIEHPPRPAG